MSLKDLEQVISKAAPVLGTALLGPAGGIVGSVVAAIFGGNIRNVPDLISKINSDPESAVKLLKIQTDHEENLQKLSIEQFQAEASDRDSARKRESDEVIATKKRDWLPATLALFIVLGFFGALLSCELITCEIKEKDILNMLIGSLATTFIQVYQFYFGSASTKNK